MTARITEYDQRLHSIESTTASLIEAFRTFSAQGEQPPQPPQALLAAKQTTGQTLGEVSDSTSDDGLQEDPQAVARWAVLNAEPMPTNYFRANLDSRLHDEESSLESSVYTPPPASTSQPAIPATSAAQPLVVASTLTTSQQAAVDDLNLQPAPKEYLDQDRFVPWEPLEAANAAALPSNDAPSLSKPQSSHASARNLRTVEDIPIVDKYNWPLACDEETDAVISLLVRYCSFRV